MVSHPGKGFLLKYVGCEEFHVTAEVTEDVTATQSQASLPPGWPVILTGPGQALSSSACFPEGKEGGPLGRLFTGRSRVSPAPHRTAELGFMAQGEITFWALETEAGHLRPTKGEVNPFRVFHLPTLWLWTRASTSSVTVNVDKSPCRPPAVPASEIIPVLWKP